MVKDQLVAIMQRAEDEEDWSRENSSNIPSKTAIQIAQ